jgi:phosphohistidine swiveling domain-containing protein
MNDVVTSRPMPAIQVPANFPVRWQDPADAAYFWMFDQIHAPEPEPLADSVYYECAYDHGITVAARAFALPLRAVTRRINTYSYLALVPVDLPSPATGAPGETAEARINAAMDRLAESWNLEYLPEIKAHLANWETLDLGHSELAQLVTWLDESIDRTKRLYEVHFLVMFPALSAISEFDDLYRDLFGSDSAFDSYRLLQGLDNETVRGGRALWQLSRRALARPAVAGILRKSSAAEVVAALERTVDGRAFLVELHEYLDRWGRRGDRWGWSYRNWIEDPTPVIKMLQDYIAQPERDLETEFGTQAAERDRLVAMARAQLYGRPRAAVERFEFLLKAAQAAIVLSEDHAYWIDFQCMYFVRQLFLELGRRFVAAGVLDQVEDSVLLTPVEMRETAEMLPRLDRRPMAAGRRAEMAYFRGVAAPATLGTASPGPPANDPVTIALGKFFGAPPKTSDTIGTVLGNSGAPGKARGPARVIRSLAEAGKLRPGDVLVAQTTAPPWTPLFASAAAVVTDTGGILSHCAVVAREYGIPAVVGTGTATSTFRDGQLIEVDGDAGTVRLI